MSIRRPAAFLPLILAVWGIAAAQEAPWVLGLTAMPDKGIPGIDAAEATGLSALPFMILERLQDLDLRFVPAEEERMAAARKKLSSLYESGSKAALSRDVRDTAALAPLPMQKRVAEERVLASRQKKQETPILRAHTAPLAPATRNIILWKGHASGQLVLSSLDPAQICRKEGLDYLILWKVEAISGFFRVRVEGWNFALGRSDFSHTAYCPRNDVSSASEELAHALILASVSRPSTRLRFAVEPPEARIFVDSRELASGRRSLRVYEERAYTVSIEAPGRTSVEFTVRTDLKSDQEFLVRLEPSDNIQVVVASEPPDAWIYLDGIWAGRTPVETSLYGTSHVALLSYPGYEDLFVVLDPKSPPKASFHLETSPEGSETALFRRKNDFYKALGWLVVSLPVSIISYGVYLQSAALHSEYPGNAAFSRRNDISLACFVISSGATAVFSVKAAVRLARYVKAAR